MNGGIEVSAEEFASQISSSLPICGLDIGEKTIGIAISDRSQIIANADRVIARKKFSRDAADIGEYIKTNEITGLVIGLPFNMDGSEGKRAQSSRAFARNLRGHLQPVCPPILLWDERYSTREAERKMLEADLSRKKRASKIDALAAAIILQGALDRLGELRKIAIGAGIGTPSGNAQNG